MGIYKLFRNMKGFLFLAIIAVAVFKGSNMLPYIKDKTKPLTSQRTQRKNNPETQQDIGTQASCIVPDYANMMPVNKLSRPEQILIRKSYIVSYNKETLNPNWVLWELTREHADGNVKRPDYAFHEDMETPEPRAELTDYRGSGYDRGHMCPAGDNKWDKQAMYETFLMSNMCPQDAQLNSGLWNQIEMSTRYWAKKYGRIFVVCGPLYLNNHKEYIGENRVRVPAAFFKAIIRLDDNPAGIAFICRNQNGNSRKKDHYVNTIREVERITGYTLFPNIDPETEKQIKDYADIKDW